MRIPKNYHIDPLTGMRWMDYERWVKEKVPSAVCVRNARKYLVFTIWPDNIGACRLHTHTAWKSAYLELQKKYGDEN